MAYIRKRHSIILLAVLGSSLAWTTKVVDKNSFQKVYNPYVQGQLLVKVDFSLVGDELAIIEDDLAATIMETYTLIDGLRLYEFSSSIDIEEARQRFFLSDSVQYAEPNWIYQANTNDPRFNDQWPLENLGQNGGKLDADINASGLYDINYPGPRVVVGIIDTGIDYTHADLIVNMWVNSLEIPGNGIDEDNSGYVDDMYGINAILNNGNPMDDNAHGTHVSGTIGASANNGIGIAGIAPNVRLAGCKFLDASGFGSTSNAIKCLQYFASLKTRAVNPENIVATSNSWGGGGFSQALYDAIKAHEKLGILFIAAAGNNHRNNDIYPSYPCNFAISNIISVAATDNLDQLASFSNYGKKTVHIAAPGLYVLSTIPNQGYAHFSGTSMAAPHVTGLAAVIADLYPGYSYSEIKNLIMAGGQVIPAATGTTMSNRKLRAIDQNGVGSLTCNGQTITQRLMPSNATTYYMVKNDVLFLSALNINCANAVGDLVLYNDATGSVVLKDNGSNGDVNAADGISSLSWIPSVAGTYVLRFNNNDSITVHVYDGFLN